MTTNITTMNCFDTVHSGDENFIRVIDSILVLLIVIATLLENIVVLLLLWRHPTFRTPTNVFVACLTLADIFVVLLPLPLFFALHVSQWKAPITWQITYHVLDTISSAMSITALCILAFDRYFIIVHPYAYQRRMTITIALVMGAFLWFYGILVGVLGVVTSERTFTLFTIVVVYGLSSLLIFFCHVNVAVIAKRHAKNILKLQVHESPVQSIKKKYSVLRKISRADFKNANTSKSFKSNLASVNSEIQFDFSSDGTTSSQASKSSTSNANHTTHENPKQKVELREISETDSKMLRLRVSVGYSEVVFQKQLDERDINKVKRSYALSNLARCKKVSISYNIEEEPTSQTLSTIVAEDEESSVVVKEQIIVPDKDKSLRHSFSSPILDTRRQQPEAVSLPKIALKKTESLPITCGKKTTQSNIRSGKSFRALVKRNIDSNRQKKMIRDEVAKIMQQLRRLRRELKATILLTVVMVIFLCLWGPYWYIHIVDFAEKFNESDSSQCLKRKYFKLLHYANATINPIYYVLLNSKLRSGCKYLLSKFCSKLTFNLQSRKKRKIQPLDELTTTTTTA